MLGEKDELEYRILLAIARSEEPVGSGWLKHRLALTGQAVSEATAGRLLRDMDERGYTCRAGFRGRTLTPEGKARLEQLERDRKRLGYGMELITAVQGRSRSELVDVLVARRGIERETVRLAAEKATDEEIKALEEIISAQDQKSRQNLDIGPEDLDFHRLIACASRNKVLQAAVNLIRQDVQLAPILAYIRREVHGSLVADHRKICQAIRQRSAAAAEKAMVEHIEGMIRDVEAYFARHGQEGDPDG